LFSIPGRIMEIPEMYRIKTDDIVLREGYCNVKDNYIIDDNKINFKKHYHERVLDKKYLDIPIKYCYNSKGYRDCKEFEEYEDGNFILVFGCSYTEGVGLHSEDIWHYHIGKELGLDVVNLGVSGTGCDFQVVNTMQWLKKYSKPKFVFYQWPGKDRKYFIVGEDEVRTSIPAQWEDAESDYVDLPSNVKYPAKQDSRWYGKRYLSWPNMCHWDYYLNVNICDQLWKGYGINPIHWTWKDDAPETQLDNMEYVYTGGIESSMARDMAHPGREIHSAVYQQLREKTNVQKIYEMA